MRIVVTAADDPLDPTGRVLAGADGVRAECGRFDVWTAASELAGGAFAVGEAVRVGDAAALHALDRELVPLYCPRCALSYCIDHWQTWDEYDPDYPGGWYEGTRGRCPENHVRLITD